MEWAELVLQYLEALTWPAVVLVTVVTFKDELRKKIAQLTKAETPVGSATFDQQARELEEQAADAIDVQHEPKADESYEASTLPDRDGTTRAGAKPLTPSGQNREPEEPLEAYRALVSAAAVLNSPPDFHAAMTISTTSPEAAVMLAYSELEKVVRAAWTVDQMTAPRRGLSMQMALRDLADSSDTAASIEPVARELARLRNRLVHGDPAAMVSASGALDFIATCETISTPLAHSALSKLHHPSRSQAIREWMTSFEPGRPEDAA